MGRGSWCNYSTVSSHQFSHVVSGAPLFTTTKQLVSVTVTEQSSQSVFTLTIKNIRKMSLWKVMTTPTMCQVTRQVQPVVQEVAQGGRFVWGKMGFKWTAEDQSKSGVSRSGSGGADPRFELPSASCRHQQQL